MELSGACTKNGTCPLVPRKQTTVSETYPEPAVGCTRNGTCPLVPRNQNRHRTISDLERQGGCTTNGTCLLVPRNQNREVFSTNGEKLEGCTRNGTCPLVPRNENWQRNVSVLEPQGGCTANGTCPLVPRKQTTVSPTYTDQAGGCTRNGTCPLVPWNQNWHRNVSDLEHRRGCTANGTCPLVPRNRNREVFRINGETGEGCSKNGACPLVPRNQNRHRNVSDVAHQGGCTANGTCPLVPKNRNRQVFPTNGEFTGGYMRNGTFPLVAQNHRNILDTGPQGGCTRNGTCPLVPKGWNLQNAAEGNFEGVCDRSGARPCRHVMPTGDFLSQKHNGGCTANGTCPLVPLEQNWIMNDFQLDGTGACTLNPQTQNWNPDAANTGNTYITRNGRCPIRCQNQNWHQNVVDVEPMGDCTCPLPCLQRWNMETGEKETELCIRNILRPWKAPIRFWHLTASEMEMTGDCTKNECPIIRCKQYCNMRATRRCCRRYTRNAMYIIKTHNQIWQLDARDLGFTEDCKTKGMSPEMPLQPDCPFESLNPTPAEGFNEKRETTALRNCNMHHDNAFQHNEQCECTFCRVQYRPELNRPIDQLMGEPQCGRNDLHSLAQQKRGRCNGLDNTLPTEVCETGNCYLSQNRRYNGWVPQMEAEIWNGNSTCTRAARKPNTWENTHTQNVLRRPGRGMCAINPLKQNRANTEPAILYQRNRKYGGRQKGRIISHNSTKDELFIQSHQY